MTLCAAFIDAASNHTRDMRLFPGGRAGLVKNCIATRLRSEAVPVISCAMWQRCVWCLAAMSPLARSHSPSGITPGVTSLQLYSLTPFCEAQVTIFFPNSGYPSLFVYFCICVDTVLLLLAPVYAICILFSYLATISIHALTIFLRIVAILCHLIEQTGAFLLHSEINEFQEDDTLAVVLLQQAAALLWCIVVIV